MAWGAGWVGANRHRLWEGVWSGERLQAHLHSLEQVYITPLETYTQCTTIYRLVHMYKSNSTIRAFGPLIGIVHIVLLTFLCYCPDPWSRYRSGLFSGTDLRSTLAYLRSLIHLTNSFRAFHWYRWGSVWFWSTPPIEGLRRLCAIWLGLGLQR